MPYRMTGGRRMSCTDALGPLQRSRILAGSGRESPRHRRSTNRSRSQAPHVQERHRLRSTRGPGRGTDGEATINVAAMSSHRISDRQRTARELEFDREGRAALQDRRAATALVTIWNAGQPPAGSYGSIRRSPPMAAPHFDKNLTSIGARPRPSICETGESCAGSRSIRRPCDGRGREGDIPRLRRLPALRRLDSAAASGCFS
jgi:hypothetical protein